MDIVCPNTETTGSNCVPGRIDCPTSEASFTMRNPTNGVTLELLCNEPTTIEIWMNGECPDEEYISTVPNVTDFAIQSGPGSVSYLSTVFPNNIYQYTPPPGLTTPQQVTFTWGSVDSQGVTTLCTKTVQMGACDPPLQNNHLDVQATIISKETLLDSDKINLQGNGTQTLILRDLDFTNAQGSFPRAIAVTDYAEVIIENCCIPGPWTVNSGDTLGFVDAGIYLRKVDKAVVRYNTISGWYNGIHTDDTNQVKIHDNIVTDCQSHMIFCGLNRNTVRGGSWVSRNYCAFTFNVDEPTGANDIINIWKPGYHSSRDFLVEQNLTVGYKGDNGSGIAIDAIYEGSGTWGGVTALDNTVIDAINGGMILTTGQDVTFDNNCVFSDIVVPTAGGTSPTSGGIGYFIFDYVNPNGGQAYPNFTGHVLTNNESYNCNVSGTGNERPFSPVNTPSSAYTLSGNNWTDGSIRPKPSPPPTTREAKIAAANAVMPNLVCYV